MFSYTVESLSIMSERARSGASFPYADVMQAALDNLGSAVLLSGDDQTGWPTPTANGYVRGLQERHGPTFLQGLGMADTHTVKAGVSGRDMDKGRKSVKVAIIPKYND